MFMGKVVDIDSQPRRRRTRKRPSKTALVLGGGGFTGGVYEIGALRALDLLAVNSTVNNFDIYVGTSAGSFVAGMLANGITPDEMMQVLNKRVPSELEDLDLDKVLRPNYLGFLQKAAALPLRGAELAAGAAQGPRDLGDRPRRGARRDPADRPLLRLGGRRLRRAGARRRRPRQRLPADGPRALHHRHRPRHHRAHRLRREGLGRRADLEGDRVLDGAADDLQAGRAEGQPDGRRRHPLDHQRRHRGRAGRQVHRRRQPDRPLRQRLREDDPDDARHPRAARLRHGHAGDRQPDLPDHVPRPPAPGGRPVAGEVPGRRHHPGRARAQRRADVRHADHGLLAAPADRPPRLRIGDRQARRGLRAVRGDRQAPRPRDLRPPRQTRRRARRRGRARADLGLAAGARADDLGAAPAVGRGGLARGVGGEGVDPLPVNSGSLRPSGFAPRVGARLSPRNYRIAFPPLRDIPGERVNALPHERLAQVQLHPSVAEQHLGVKVQNLSREEL